CGAETRSTGPPGRATRRSGGEGVAHTQRGKEAAADHDLAPARLREIEQLLELPLDGARLHRVAGWPVAHHVDHGTLRRREARHGRMDGEIERAIDAEDERGARPRQSRERHVE